MPERARYKDDTTGFLDDIDLSDITIEINVSQNNEEDDDEYPSADSNKD